MTLSAIERAQVGLRWHQRATELERVRQLLEEERTRAAVAIAPTGCREQPRWVRRIGVGYDGSPESRHALRVGRALARETGARLSGFQAVWLPSYLFIGSTPDEDTSLENMLAEARAELAALDVEPHVTDGRAAEELALYSTSLDLLVVGSRSYGPLGRAVHGSTTQQLVGSARCPLLVLTSGTRETQSDAGGPSHDRTATT